MGRGRIITAGCGRSDGCCCGCSRSGDGCGRTLIRMYVVLAYVGVCCADFHVVLSSVGCCGNLNSDP